jgi:plastocyanin
MGRRPATLLALCAASLIAGGCGSSSNGAPATSATTSTSSPPSTAGGIGSATGSSAGSPKVDKAPRYAAPSPSAPVRSGLVQVAYHDITIAPDTLRVKVGSTIRWTNYDPVEHNVTSQGGVQRFASKNFGEGGTFEIKANRPGVIHYLCTIHPTSMNGTIEVVN